MSYLLEVIGFNIESCVLAQDAGAGRIELCAGAAEGGTTPSYGFIKAARAKLQVSLYPIIRPRGGDFLYTEDEFKLMLNDLALCKELDCDGVVTGFLHADGSVDKERCKTFIELAYPLKVTFHRAFDRTCDPFKAMEDIIETGFERILTSGLKPFATEGSDLIAALIEKAAGRINIMPGSGINAANISAIAKKTMAFEFHASARTTKKSNMKYQNECMHEDLTAVTVDNMEIKKMIQLLNEI